MHKWRGYQSFRLIPSFKLLCPMVFPPSSIIFYSSIWNFLSLRFLSILSSLYLCTVTTSLFILLCVTLSDVLVCFSLSTTPYSVMDKVYVLGGPYLLSPRFHDLYLQRSLPPYHPFISELPFERSFHRVLSYSLIFLSRFRSFPCEAVLQTFIQNMLSLVLTALAIFWSGILLNGPLVCTALSCFILCIWTLLVHWLVPLSWFSLCAFYLPIGPHHPSLSILRGSTHFFIGPYRPFFFSLLFMFLLYHSPQNCQYIFENKFKFFYSFCFIIFICEFSENSCNISVIYAVSFTVHHLPCGLFHAWHLPYILYRKTLVFPYYIR